MRQLLLLIAAVPMAACTSRSGPVTEPGASIYTPDVRKLVIENDGGGFEPERPPDAACYPAASLYTLTVGGRQLAWKTCDETSSDGMPVFTLRTGSRTLADAEWSMLQPTLAGLVVSDQRTCSEDAPELTVTVTGSGGDFVYHDDINSCLGPPNVYVLGDGVGAVLGALGELSRK